MRQSYKAVYFLPQNEKAFLAGLTELVKENILTGCSKDFIVKGLLQTKTFTDRGRALKFVEGVIKNMEMER